MTQVMEQKASKPPTEEEIEAFNQAMMKARLWLMNHPGAAFFADICLNLTHVIDNSVPTAATDGRTIYYNTEFFMGLPASHRVGLMLHEVLHVACAHMTRVNGRQQGKFNRACDYSINIIIDQAGFQLPEGGLLDYQYDKMAPEEIYGLLEDEPEDEEPGDIIEIDSDDESLMQDIEDMLVSAQQASERAGDKPGSIPGELERQINKILNPTVPWTAILAGYFTRLARRTYDWKRPNRRFFTQGVILPSKAGHKLCDGAIGVDVSASVLEEQFESTINEAADIIAQQDPDKLHFIQFDTRIAGEVTVVEKLEDLKGIKFKAGGGTAIDPLMQWAKDNNPSWLIVFTDGYYDPPTIEPSCPVIWAVYDNKNFKAPFGKHIVYTHPEKK